MRDISIIVAVDERGAIGYRGRLLCHLPADLRHFKQVTMGHAVVMGRLTALSLPGGALPGRQNIVISRNPEFRLEGFDVATSLGEAFETATADVMVIGGGQVYREAIDEATTLYITRIHHIFADADTFFPDIDPDVWEVVECEKRCADERNPFDFTFLIYKRK